MLPESVVKDRVKAVRRGEVLSHDQLLEVVEELAAVRSIDVDSDAAKYTAFFESVQKAVMLRASGRGRSNDEAVGLIRDALAAFDEG